MQRTKFFDLVCALEFATRIGHLKGNEFRGYMTAR